MSNTTIIKYSKNVIFLISRLQRADGQATYFTVIIVFCQQNWAMFLHTIPKIYTVRRRIMFAKKCLLFTRKINKVI